MLIGTIFVFRGGTAGTVLHCETTCSRCAPDRPQSVRNISFSPPLLLCCIFLYNWSFVSMKTGWIQMAPPCALPHLHLKNIFALLQTIRVHFFVIVFFFLLLFFGFLENYSAHPRGAVEVTVTDGKREACCHREKVRERKKKSCENEEGKKNSFVENVWRRCSSSSRSCREALCFSPSASLFTSRISRRRQVPFSSRCA